MPADKPAGPPPTMARSYARRLASRWRPSLRARSSLVGSSRWVPSPKTTVGMVRPPPCPSSTNRMPSALSSMSTHSKGTRCSARNRLARLQSGHQGAPYTVMSAMPNPPESVQGVEDGGQVVELAQKALDDVAVLIDDDHRRWRRDVVGRTDLRVRVVDAAVGNRVVVVKCDGRCVVVADIHAQENDSACGVLRVELVEVGLRRAAGTAPRRPEIEHHGMALNRRPGKLRAGDGRGVDGRRQARPARRTRAIGEALLQAARRQGRD